VFVFKYIVSVLQHVSIPVGVNHICCILFILDHISYYLSLL